MKVEIRVALLTESVDRNAWQHFPAQLDIVALLTESVDRNASVLVKRPLRQCRSPHGERG